MNCFMSRSLGALCDVSIGRTPRRNQSRYWGGPHPWATIRDLNDRTLKDTEQGITDAALDEVMPKPVKPKTLLFSFKLSIGKMAFAGRTMHHNEAIAALPIRDPNVLDREYLFYALKARTHAKDANHAVLGKVLNKRKVEEIQIPLPPLEEQTRIVGILNRAAKIKRLRAQAAERLREFVPALFVKMFGDPVENPMGWAVRVLEEICISARYGTSKKASEHVGGIPILRMGNVTYDGYLDCDSKNLKYAELKDSEIEKYALHSGDILFNRTNSKDLVGKTGIWDGRFEAVPASYFIRLRVDQAVIHPTYLWAYMNSSAVKRRLFEMARGAIGQANINAKELKSMPLPVPPLALQLRYVEICEAMKSTTKVTQYASRTSSSLAASLLSCLLQSSRMQHRVTKAILP